MTSDILCIYHGNCADGFGAAWVVRKALGKDIQFHAGRYGETPPDVTGKHVVIVDFSYKRPVLEEMASKAKSILVLDHHESAAEDLAGLPLPVDYGPTGPAPADWGCVDVVAGYNRDALHDHARQCNGPPVYAIFDMERSGAGLTWDFFHHGKPRPALINHIEDRDLWRFQLKGTREIQAALFSYPYDFQVWDRLFYATDIQTLFNDGWAIERKHHKDVEELVNGLWYKMVIGGYVVPVCSLPYTYSSDAGNLMCQGLDEGLGGLWIPPFAACYWDTAKERVFSLRSIDKLGGVNVSKVAVEYGGGGHKNAAGFSMPVGWSGDK